MRVTRDFLRTVAGCCLLWAISCGDAAAQSSRDKVSFRNIRVGYPPGPHAATPDEVIGGRTPQFKAGAWTPVIVDVQNTGRYDPGSDGPAIVSVETNDSDDMSNSYSAPLPPFDEGGSSSVMLFTRTGSRFADITIRIQGKGRDLCPAVQQSYTGLDANQLLYLALGSRLPGLKLPGMENQPEHIAPRAEVGLLTRVVELPTQWIGYGSADIVILATSDRDFVTALIGDQSGRKAALAEWVRRGGNLIVSAGRNRDQFAGSAELQALFPMTIEGPYVANGHVVRWREGGNPIDEPLAHPDDKPVEFTRFRSRDDREIRVLVEGPEASPLIVQGPYGLGRVTLVGFDIDQRPVRGWAGEKSFWEQLLLRSGPRLVTQQSVNQFGFSRYGGEEADQILQSVVNRLDQFEGVPVISFGWVALFILLYILVVGPLDYLFLKKVVKRLELTWITFPTVVLAVSAAAYFTAYHLKGSDLRINRTDIVDYDFQTKQVYGRSFFTIFSPRIQKYTIGVTPSDGWAGAMDETNPSGTVVSWLGIPKMGRQSFFRHSYEYARHAEGLLNVPINVWSTKGFQAWWAAPIDKSQSPFTVALSHPGNRTDEIIGSVTSHLPADLEDAVLIYRGSVATLGTMLPGVPKTVSAAERIKFSQWHSSTDNAPPPDVNVERPIQQMGLGPTSAIAARLDMDLLFHEAKRSNSDASNGALRDIDQSWRVNDRNQNEAILVARLKQAKGTAEEINSGQANPTRLWLGRLPTDRQPGGQAETRPELQGTMRQDVYVRVFVPIQANGAKKE